MEVIDALVHPQVSHRDELRRYMKEPLRRRPFPPPERYFYPNPLGDFLPEAASASGAPGSDPSLVSEALHRDARPDAVVLLPLTRGLLPDVELGSAVCAATNDWLADVWLDKGNAHGKFRGTIRVNPMDPSGAVREIERWAEHPYMVQIGIPTQAHAPYGQRFYHPIWEAAERHDLPVAVHLDNGSGVDFPPTMTGYARHFVEYSVLSPINYSFHLASLIAEGTFERSPGLRFVFTDGGVDVLQPLIWRLTKDWWSTKVDTPWVAMEPGEYLREHVRFCIHRLEGPQADEDMPSWAGAAHYADLLMYGSRYPFWDYLAPSEAARRLPPDVGEKVFAGNAAGWYRLTESPKRP
ncbi:MAG: amidohydrolase family protein [Streptosporangiales bacterium]|nr:amidohydrolase family protein [Streptosporangiales bacterium]